MENLDLKQIYKVLNELSKDKNPFSRLRNTAIIYLLWGCGLRVSEVLSLNSNQIKENYIIVVGKGKKERIVPLLPEIKEKILIWESWIKHGVPPNKKLNGVRETLVFNLTIKK